MSGSTACRRRIIKNRRAASPAVSMVIITAAAVVLVVISANYALQVLQRQEAEAEFKTVQDSILTFDDALRDIAWDRDGTRSVRFTIKYGNMRLIDSSKTFTISGLGLNGTYSHEFTTASVKYQMPYGYGISGSESLYILGDKRTVVSNLTDSLGQAFVEQESGSANITLNYRVRVSEEGSVKIGSTTVNYVDIFVIRLKCESSAIGGGDFDLVCRNIGLETKSSDVYNVIDATACISVSDSTDPVGTVPDSIYLKDLNLDGNIVIFNLIIADVRVSA